MSKNLTTKLVSAARLLSGNGTKYPIIFTSQSIILERGMVVGTPHIHYCVAPLIIGKKYYGFMHFEGHENKKNDEEMLNKTIKDLKDKFGEKDLYSIIYSLPNYDSDDFSTSTKKSRENEEKVKEILNSHNIQGKTLFGSASEIVVNQDCKIVSALEYKLTSLSRQL